MQLATIENNSVGLAGSERTLVEQSRAIQEVQGALIIARRFPRDESSSFMRIIKACERKGLAETAQYAYPRGGQMVTGPSIRLAEVLAQNWGNLDFGIRELSQENGWSEVEAYCWDMESNVRQTKTFRVKLERHTKRGTYALKDPRDIYEHVANQGARRLRACILGVIPGDLVEKAVEQCEKTLSGGDGVPLKARARKMLQAFDGQGVTVEMIQEKLGHKIEAITEQELANLRKIYTSIKDGVAKREDFFNLPQANGVAELEKEMSQQSKEQTETKKGEKNQ